ncbi:hypothetical protein ACHQM5_017981 [Ranunculus cassubicifolius]
MGTHKLLIALFLLAMASSVLAYDPSPLQDFCVADPNSPVFVNGFACKNPRLVNNRDFIFQGNFNVPGNTANALGSAVTQATVNQFPALNTLGVSIFRVDIAPGGVNAPNVHPRASEIFAVIQGTVLVGFVTSNPENRLFTNVLYPGDVTIFPKGLVHFQINIGHVPAVVFNAFGSQNPGVVIISNNLFNSTPPIPDIVLQRSFAVAYDAIEKLRAQFAA